MQFRRRPYQPSSCFTTLRKSIETLEFRRLLAAAPVGADPLIAEGADWFEEHDHANDLARGQTPDGIYMDEDGHVHCGVDHDSAPEFVVGAGWATTLLSYSYSNLLDGNIPGGTTNAQWHTIIEEALLLWSSVSPLRFLESSDPGGAVNDNDYASAGFPRMRFGHHFIDGSSGSNVLAHARFPDTSAAPNDGINGDFHYDNGNTWSWANADYTIETATHEIGHALGMRHTNGNVSGGSCPPLTTQGIMHACILGVFPAVGEGFLYADDIAGIQNIYGNGYGYVLDLADNMTVGGTDANNTINVNIDATTITVSSNGFGSFTRSTSGVSSLTVSARAGNDSIFINQTNSSIPITVVGADGNDTLYVGNGDYDTNIAGNIRFEGGAGTNVIVVNDLTDASGNDTYTITQASFAKALGGTLSWNLAELSEFSVIGNGFDNAFNVLTWSSLISAELLGAGGNDVFNISPSGAGDFDSDIGGFISCSGGAGGDTIFIHDTTDTGNDSYQVSGNAFTKNGNTTARVVASSSTEIIQINGSNNNDSYNVPQVSPWLSVVIQAGSGNDSFTAGNNNLDANISTAITFDGNLGIDSITITDGLGTTVDTYNFDNNSLDKGGSGQINYLDAESFTMTLNADDNDFNIFSTHSSTPLLLNTGSGDDTVDVGLAGTFLFNFGSSPTINGGGGTDVLNVYDADFAGTGNYTLTNGVVVLPFNGESAFHSNMENVLINASQGANSIFVNQTNIPVFVLGNDGDDAIFVGNGDFDLNITANVLVLGGNGNDTVTYSDALDTLDDTYTITSASVAKNSTAALLQTNFFGPTIDNIVILAGSANHTFNLNSTGSNNTATNVSISASGGNDTINVGGGDLDGLIYGDVTVTGGSGADSLYINDLNDTGTDTMSMIVSSLTKSSWTFSLTLPNDIENTVLDMSNDAGILQLTSMPNTELRVNGNDGNDSVVVDSTHASHNVTLSSGTGSDALRVNNDGVGTAHVVVDSNDSLSTLSISIGGLLTLAAGTNTTLEVTSTLAINGRLDVNDNRYIYQLGSVPFHATRLLTGYAGGAWTTAAQPAIFSSVAASATSPKDAVGFAVAGEIGVATFGGFAVAAGAVLVGYTQYGDTDLDRDVDFNDLLRLSQSYGMTGKYWHNGSFNYDAAGAVNFDDLLALSQNYNTTLLASPTTDRAKSRAGVLGALRDDEILV